MKTISRFLIVCILTFVVGNFAIDKVTAWEAGDCPSCYVFERPYDIEYTRCASACLPPSVEGYYFHMSYWKLVGFRHASNCQMMAIYEPVTLGVNALMVDTQLSNCKGDCDEWTACMSRGVTIDYADKWADQWGTWTEGPMWAITQGEEITQESIVCEGDDLTSLPPWF
jgi:hypothetical protein